MLTPNCKYVFFEKIKVRFFSRLFYIGIYCKLLPPENSLKQFLKELRLLSLSDRLNSGKEAVTWQ